MIALAWIVLVASVATAAAIALWTVSNYMRIPLVDIAKMSAPILLLALAVLGIGWSADTLGLSDG